MARILLFDEKSVKNRNRVQKHRYNKYLKKIHNQEIERRIKNLTLIHHDVSTANHLNDADLKNYDEPNEFKQKLRVWVLNHRITRTAVSELLLILISAGFVFLPKDARTLMSTPVEVPIKMLTNGKMWYNGIQKSLEKVLLKVQRSINITLDFNIDGMPISNSSTEQFWPILSAIQGIKIICSQLTSIVTIRSLLCFVIFL